MSIKTQDNLQNALAEFENACNQLLNTKYILAEKKISILLQIIAKHKELYELVAKCMDGFDFKTEFFTAKSHVAKGTGLRFPQDPKNIVALVFCLLLSFDTKQTDFKQFLSAFYYNREGPEKEFDIFVSETITLFCASIVYLLNPSAFQKEKEIVNIVTPTQETSQKIFVSQPSIQEHKPKPQYHPLSYSDEISATKSTYNEPVVVKSQKLDQLTLLALHTNAKELIGLVARDVYLSTQDKEEMMLVCEAFEQAVASTSIRAIRTMYIALKNTLKSSSIIRFLEPQYTTIDTLMDKLGID
ncbi:MAG: hypothetical protein FWE13_06390 [Firmicutes bacterium]|nr:hypothetical protein [Bacillota bacterium]